MNLPLFIAQRMIKGRREGESFSRPINVIAIVGILLIVGLSIGTFYLIGYVKKKRQ